MTYQEAEDRIREHGLAEGWLDEETNTRATAAEMVAKMREYDGYQLLPIGGEGAEGAEVAAEFAAGLAHLGELETLKQFVRILAFAPGNAYPGR